MSQGSTPVTLSRPPSSWKNTAKVANPKVDRSAQYDDTLKTKSAEQDHETKRFFKEMKKREF